MLIRLNYIRDFWVRSAFRCGLVQPSLPGESPTGNTLPRQKMRMCQLASHGGRSRTTAAVTP